MSNRIPPLVHRREQALTRRVPGIVTDHRWPEAYLETVEVRADVPWIGIPCIELPTELQLAPEDDPDRQWFEAVRQVVDTLCVQVPAKTLKSRGEQKHVGLIDLLSRVARAGANPPDCAMGSLHLIQRPPAIHLPGMER
jgi:hypothetical protein